MGWSLLVLGGMLLAVGALLTAATVFLMAWSLLRPPRMTDGKAAWLLRRLSPGDLGLPYEDVSFSVRDERTGQRLRLAAWWIPAAEGARPSENCVVLLPGYADAKVGVIAWAPVWHVLGFNILALDPRAHGDSGGHESTAGYFERHDINQVIDRLRGERPAATRQVVLFGASLGAAVAVAAAALRDDVAAVVLESPFADFRAASAAHMDLLGLPGGFLQSAALRLAERMSGANFDDVRPIDVLRSVRCPALVIAPTDDVFLPPADAAAFESALAARPPGSGPGEIWRVEGARHLLGVHADDEAYARRLQDFLAAALGRSLIPIDPSSAKDGPAGVNAGRGAV